jgi:hypothetical protein
MRVIPLDDVLVAYSPPGGDHPAIPRYELVNQKGGDDLSALQ